MNGGDDRDLALERLLKRALNDDAPAIWLYAAANTAVASRQLQAPTFTPFAWLDGVTGWQKRDR